MRAPPRGRRDGRRMSEEAAESLLWAIDRVAGRREACARDPARDFTRERKIPLPALVWIMVTWAWDTIGTELEDAYGWDGSAPTASAFCQQRAKLNDKALPFLLSGINPAVPRQKNLNGYRLVAVDGSDVDIPPCHDSPDTFVPSKSLFQISPA